MRVVIFFGYLCYLLLKGYGYLYADNHKDVYCNTLTHSITKTAQQLKFTNPNLSTVSNEVEEYLVDDDIEAGGRSNSFVRKYKLLTRHYLPRPSTFVLSDLPFKDRQSFHSLLSCKYVVQRALRI